MDEFLPYMATENILMAAVSRGGDRQTLHERIRQHSMAVAANLKAGAARNDLLERLQADPAFAGVDFAGVLSRGYFAGRAPEQVDEFIAQEVEPIRQRYPLVGRKRPTWQSDRCLLSRLDRGVLDVVHWNAAGTPADSSSRMMWSSATFTMTCSPPSAGQIRT